nr:MAG TPA: hypothetical protein [Caudoviricetes sp.]
MSNKSFLLCDYHYHANIKKTTPKSGQCASYTLSQVIVYHLMRIISIQCVIFMHFFRKDDIYVLYR